MTKIVRKESYIIFIPMPLAAVVDLAATEDDLAATDDGLAAAVDDGLAAAVEGFAVTVEGFGAVLIRPNMIT